MNNEPLSAANPARRATIAEVAHDAGVSKTSVSRYLGGEFSALSDDIRGRIEASIARLGYQPSQMARGLKRGQTRLIGMVVADVLNPYSVAVLHGAEAACRKHGYTLVLTNTGNDEALERDRLAALTSYSVEGLIVHTQGRNVKELQHLAAGRLPVVLVDRKLAGFPFDLVGLDNHQAARAATQHLLERGFRDIALVTEPLSGVSSRQEREASFRLAMAENPDSDAHTIEFVQDAPDALAAALTRFIAGPVAAGRRKAVIAANGVVTLHVIRALRGLGLRVPEDVGLLGFDELEWSALVGPGITTIGQPTYDIGFAAFECLWTRLNGDSGPPRQILYPATLTERGSTGQSPVNVLIDP
jgi:LacI family kdg operon repressor